MHRRRQQQQQQSRRRRTRVVLQIVQTQLPKTSNNDG